MTRLSRYAEYGEAGYSRGSRCTDGMLTASGCCQRMGRHLSAASKSSTRATRILHGAGAQRYDRFLLRDTATVCGSARR